MRYMSNFLLSCISCHQETTLVVNLEEDSRLDWWYCSLEHGQNIAIFERRLLANHGATEQIAQILIQSSVWRVILGDWQLFCHMCGLWLEIAQNSIYLQRWTLKCANTRTSLAWTHAPLNVMAHCTHCVNSTAPKLIVYKRRTLRRRDCVKTNSSWIRQWISLRTWIWICWVRCCV